MQIRKPRCGYGDVVRMVVENGGLLFHEVVIGTKSELDEHAALMVKVSNMEHEEPYMSLVNAGSQGQLRPGWSRTMKRMRAWLGGGMSP